MNDIMKLEYQRCLSFKYYDIDKAKEFAHECAQKAIASLKDLYIDTTILEQFALFAVNRDH